MVHLAVPIKLVCETTKINLLDDIFLPICAKQPLQGENCIFHKGKKDYEI